jgi:hypothetical protein
VLRTEIANNIKRIFGKDEGQLELKTKDIQNLIEVKYYQKIFGVQMAFLRLDKVIGKEPETAKKNFALGVKKDSVKPNNAEKTNQLKSIYATEVKGDRILKKQTGEPTFSPQNVSDPQNPAGQTRFCPNIKDNKIDIEKIEQMERLER